MRIARIASTYASMEKERLWQTHPNDGRINQRVIHHGHPASLLVQSHDGQRTDDDAIVIAATLQWMVEQLDDGV